MSLRAKQAQKLNDLKGRIKASALAQEGTDPPENPGHLIEEYLTLSGEHRELVSQITATNAGTTIEGQTLAAMLQEREELIRERNIYSFAASAASSQDIYRFTRSELKYVTTLNVAQLREDEETAGEKVRALDVKIQAANWSVELL